MRSGSLKHQAVLAFGWTMLLVPHPTGVLLIAITVHLDLITVDIVKTLLLSASQVSLF